MTRFPFIPKAVPTAPGSSHYVSNALIIAARVALGLKEPVRIQFSPSGKASESLSEWRRNHSNTSVQTLQLRKEQKAPFFHEYIAFSLRDKGGCFRIDRRQLPNEGSPLDCTEIGGVEAFETIEDILDLEHSMYSDSDCLVQIDFEEDVRPDLIIDICREISQHAMANVYTVQRYNCYFYAQTILLCTLCKKYDWYKNYIWGSEGENNDSEGLLTDKMPLADLSREPRIRIFVLDKEMQPHLASSNDIPYSGNDLPSPVEGISFWRSPMRLLRPQRKGGQSNTMRETDIGDLQEYISDMIYAHSARVEHYKVLLKSSAWEVERDIKQTMNEIWGKNWLLLGQVDPTLLQPSTSHAKRYRSGQKGRQSSGTGQGSGLKRRSRVTTKKGWEREWEVVNLASEIAETW